MVGRNQYSKPRFLSDTHKECSCCEKVLPHECYHKDKRAPAGLAYYCITCVLEKQRKWHKEKSHLEEYRNRRRSSYMKMNYGITLEERTKLLEQQEFKCAICQIELKTQGTHTHTDHCHGSGKVRGILCTNCNRGLGHFKDSVSHLRAAIDYLSRTENGTQKEVTNP
jgi:hypothetical protein